MITCFTMRGMLCYTCDGEGDGEMVVKPWDKSRYGEERMVLEGSFTIHTDWCLIWPYRMRGGRPITYGEDGEYTVVTRWICEKLYGPSPSKMHVAAHSCNNGHIGCINWQHLRWATRSENQSDRKNGHHSKIMKLKAIP
jgi:HNH endonuclease